MKKLVVYLIALGLSLNGFCMNLLAPTAMAMPMVAPVLTMQAKTLETMPMTETVANCGNMDMTANLNCCLVPLNHGSDKSFEIKAPQETRQHLNTFGIKVEPVDILKTNEKRHLRPFQHLEGSPSPPSLTGQIIKKE